VKVLLKRVLGSFVLLAGLVQAAPLPDLSVGKSFPEILLPRSNDGSLESLAQHRGKKLMVHVFAGW